jgi:LAO/AO transport system kinase
VAGLADTTVVLVAPGMGDGIQAAKAGILEVGDVFVVNKADRDGADATVRDLEHMIRLGGGTTTGASVRQQPGERRGPGEWRPPVLRTVASTGQGLEDVVAALADHASWARQTGALQARRRRRAAREVETIAVTVLRGRIGGLRDGSRLERLADGVVAGSLDPYAAADLLLEDLTG